MSSFKLVLVLDTHMWRKQVDRNNWGNREWTQNRCFFLDTLCATTIGFFVVLFWKTMSSLEWKNVHCFSNCVDSLFFLNFFFIESFDSKLKIEFLIIMKKIFVHVGGSIIDQYTNGRHALTK